MRRVIAATGIYPRVVITDKTVEESARAAAGGARLELSSQGFTTAERARASRLRGASNRQNTPNAFWDRSVPSAATISA